MPHAPAAIGTPPTRNKRAVMRRVAKRCMGNAGLMPCTASLLSWYGQEQNDPELSEQLGQINTWFVLCYNIRLLKKEDWLYQITAPTCIAFYVRVALHNLRKKRKGVVLYEKKGVPKMQ